MINNNKIKYRVEIRKENEKFKLLYEGNDNIFNIVDLYQDTNYEIRLCSFDNNIPHRMYFFMIFISIRELL